jgi:chemotaxis signal transduction protein
MTPMVRFRAGGGRYAVPAQAVRQVRTGDGVSILPGGRAGVAGLVKWDGAALPVLALFGPGRRRLLVIETGGQRFGLLAEDVTGVVVVDEGKLGPPPAGQDGDLIAGVLDAGDDLVLVLDPAAIARVALG